MLAPEADPSRDALFAQGTDEAPPTLATRVAIIRSCDSGGAASTVSFAESIAERVRAAGGEVVSERAECSIPDQARFAREAKPRLVIALGGDGTINASAATAIAAGADLLILPNGTMNLVAKDIRLPLDPERVLDYAGDLTRIRIDYATVNGRVFLHSALLGVVADMAVAREDVRRSHDAPEKLAALGHLAEAALASEPLEVLLEAEKGSRKQQTRCVAVTCNPLIKGGVVEHGRATLTAGRLGVYASDHHGPLAPIKLLASLGTGQLPQDPETLSTDCATLTIHAKQSTLSVSLDGEVFELDTPLKFTIEPRGLSVAVPTGNPHGPAGRPGGPGAGSGPVAGSGAGSGAGA